MYFHKPQEKPRLYGSFQDRQYSIWRNLEKIYGVDHESEVLIIPGFWGFPLLDYSGKNNHGTNYGATYKDGSLDFDGATVLIPHKAGQDGSAITLSAQIYWKGLFGGYDNIIIKPAYAYQMYIQTDSTLRFYSSNSNIVSSNTAVPVNQWSHVVISADGTANSAFYINGDNVRSVTLTPSTGKIGHIEIGHWGASSNPFNGLINEVRISNVARTADQIALFHDRSWDLYRPVSRPVWSIPAAGGIAPTGNLYGSFYGPLAGVI